MASVTVELPALLVNLTDAGPTVRVEAESLSSALDALVAAHPDLDVHLYDESRTFREHVLVFLNGENTRWFDSLERPLADGDTILVMQAVSGG